MIISATDPAHAQASESAVEQAIGHQVRRYRNRLGLTIKEMCERTGLSAGMVSKIEYRNISPFARNTGTQFPSRRTFPLPHFFVSSGNRVTRR
jgi:hypothetical protein